MLSKGPLLEATVGLAVVGIVFPACALSCAVLLLFFLGVSLELVQEFTVTRLINEELCGSLSCLIPITSCPGGCSERLSGQPGQSSIFPWRRIN